MAYASEESGKFEVYVRQFPSGEGMVKISTSGGYQPRWRADGKELCYLAEDGKINAVDIKAVAASNGSVEPGIPRPLLDSHIEIRILENLYAPVPMFDYDVSADGKRFIVSPAVEAESAPPLTVVTNWVEGSKR